MLRPYFLVCRCRAPEPKLLPFSSKPTNVWCPNRCWALPEIGTYKLYIPILAQHTTSLGPRDYVVLRYLCSLCSCESEPAAWPGGWAKAHFESHFAGDAARNWLIDCEPKQTRKKSLTVLKFQKSAITWGRIAKPKPSFMVHVYATETAQRVSS